MSIDNAKRFLPDEIFSKRLDDSLRGFKVSPRSRLAQTGNALVGVDLDEEITRDRHRAKRRRFSSERPPRPDGGPL